MSPEIFANVTGQNLPGASLFLHVRRVGYAAVSGSRLVAANDIPGDNNFSLGTVHKPGIETQGVTTETANAESFEVKFVSPLGRPDSITINGRPAHTHTLIDPKKCNPRDHSGLFVFSHN